jgi:5-methylcytosine-specific restriction endonuclease McrA
MRECTACYLSKPLDAFFVKDKKLGRLHTQCKACYSIKRKLYYKKHYQKYANEYRARAILRNKLIKGALKLKLSEYLSDKSCSRCGITDSRVLEFDHMDPATKSFGINNGIRNSLHWERILEEIEKCQILCANCHRIRTAEQFGWGDK